MDAEVATTRRPRVAHVTTVDMSLRYLLLNQMKYLQEHGYDVTGISAPGPDVDTLTEAGIPHIAVPFTRRVTPIRDLIAFWKLYRIFRREQFDIVHTHTPKPGLYGQIAARLAGVPLVVNTVHGFYFRDDMPGWVRWGYVQLEKLAARMSHVILSQSSEDVETAVELGIASRDKISHLGNGIDLTRFDPSTISDADVAEVRRELGLEPHHRVIGFVGRLVREKGVIELLEAVASIREDFPDVRLLLVGPVDREKTDAVTPEEAQRRGVSDICVFAGLRSDLPRLYAAMEVFVLPSYREGVPRAPMEASAMGVPIIVSNVRGCREVVSGGTGLVCLTRSAKSLSAGLRLLLQMPPDEAMEMREAGKLRAQTLFAEERVFERVLYGYRTPEAQSEPTELFPSNAGAVT